MAQSCPNPEPSKREVGWPAVPILAPTETVFQLWNSENPEKKLNLFEINNMTINPRRQLVFLLHSTVLFFLLRVNQVTTVGRVSSFKRTPGSYLNCRSILWLGLAQGGGGGGLAGGEGRKRDSDCQKTGGPLICLYSYLTGTLVIIKIDLHLRFLNALADMMVPWWQLPWNERLDCWWIVG